MKTTLILLALMVILITGCSSSTAITSELSTEAVEETEPAECLDSETSKKLLDAAKKFSDVHSVAANTAKIQLAPVILQMQSVRGEAEEMEIPDCAKETHDKLIDYMNWEIEGFTNFMGGGSSQSEFMNAEISSSEFLHNFGITEGTLVKITTNDVNFQTKMSKKKLMDDFTYLVWNWSDFDILYPTIAMVYAGNGEPGKILDSETLPVLKSHELIKFSYYNSDEDKNKGIVVEDLDDVTIELIEGYVRK